MHYVRISLRTSILWVKQEEHMKLLQGTKDKNCISNKLQKQIKQAEGQRDRGSS